MSSFTSVADSEEESHHEVARLRNVRSAMSKLRPRGRMGVEEVEKEGVSEGGK